MKDGYSWSLDEHDKSGMIDAFQYTGTVSRASPPYPPLTPTARSLTRGPSLLP